MLNYSAMTNYLYKNYVKNGHLYDQFQGVDPLFTLILGNKNSGNRTGVSIDYPLAVGRSTSISSNFASAQQQAKATGTSNTNKRKVVVVPFDKDVYAVGRVKKKPIFATKGGSHAFVKAVDDESKMVIDSLKSRTSADLWRDGTGLIGEANAATTNGTFVLKNYVDLWYYEVGMEFCIAGSTATERTVTHVNRQTKTISFTPTVNVAANAKMYFPADSSTSGAGSFDGVAKIITNSSLSTAYRGVDRSLDPTRLAGWVITDRAKNSSTNPTPILEAVRRAAILMDNFHRRVKGKPSLLPSDLFLGSATWELLAGEYEAKTEMRRMNSNDLKDGVTGFEGLRIIVGGKVVRAWACPSLNPLTGYLLNTDSWGFNWLGSSEKEPVVFDKMTNGTFFKDVDDDDAIEFRMQFHPILWCNAPGMNAKISFTNNASNINSLLTVT